MIHLTPEQRVFVTERHVASLATLRPDGTAHVVPVAFTWDPETGTAWMMTDDGSVKVRNVEAGLARGGSSRGALCQVSGGRWITVEGELAVLRDPVVIADVERRHRVRYGPMAPDPRRVVLRMAVDRVMGSQYMTR